MQEQGDRDPPPEQGLPPHQPEGSPGEPVRERHWWAGEHAGLAVPPGIPPRDPFQGGSSDGGDGGGGPPGPRRPIRRPDPGTPRAAWIAGILTCFLILAVAGLQQFSALGGGQQPPGAPTAPLVEAPDVTFEITAKVYVRVYNAFPDEQVTRDALRTLSETARTASDRLRLVIVDAELNDAESALQRLAELEPDLNEPLRKDAATLRRIYRGDDPSAEQLEHLLGNHGWFGKLAAAHDLPNTDPARAQVVGGGMLLLAMMAVLGLLGLGALLTGFVLLIVAIVWFSSGRLRPRFVPPLPGGSVAIETVAMFVGGFLLLKVGSGFLAGAIGESRAVWAAMLLQWLLLLTLLWPMVRGVRLQHTLALWGLHGGRGILREIGAGFVGYLACLPLLMIGVVTTLVLMFLYQVVRKAMGMPEAPPPSNPIFEIVGRPGGWLMVVLLVLLASVWAPLVEETVFRGALYRHLRARWHWLLSGFVTALAFGIMHGYQVFMLGPVIALGFGFALLREWRGSLIASITAHAIHNTVVLMIVIFVLRVIVA